MLTRLIASVSAWTFPRSCSQDRNESFSLGVGLGGFFVVAVLALTPMTTPAWANCFGDLTGPVGIPDGTVGIEDLQAVTSSWNHY
ncbi:MAG: hypothetical protein MK077_08460, partial [Phycisphaerales bacterium]|nr:hypothetical protein [Phycisphaerales bacterium]